MPASPSTIAELRHKLKAIEGVGVGNRPVLSFGIELIDKRLGDAGLRMDALHEVAGEGCDWGDEAAAALFMAGIAARTAGPVLWVLRTRDLFAPGLYQAGLDPARLIYAEARDDAELLALMEEGLRHRGLGAVVGEAKRVPTPATRRLQLAAEGGSAIALLLKRPPEREGDPFGLPSAAVTRWGVASAASPTPHWDGLGRACWHVSCVRQRGGDPFELDVEAPDETGRLAVPARLVDRPATVVGMSQRAVA